jgi:hypothetical protein
MKTLPPSHQICTVGNGYTGRYYYKHPNYGWVESQKEFDEEEDWPALEMLEIAFPIEVAAKAMLNIPPDGYVIKTQRPNKYNGSVILLDTMGRKFLKDQSEITETQIQTGLVAWRYDKMK